MDDYAESALSALRNFRRLTTIGVSLNQDICSGDLSSSPAVVWWLSMQTHNTGVVASNPARVTMKRHW